MENPAKQEEEYKRIMAELQERELGPDDYDLLLSLEQKQTQMPLNKFLANTFEKVFKPP